MNIAELLHYAFRANDPLALAEFYADLFEGKFFLHPTLTGLGIVMVKFNHPELLWHGLVEFWPWDLVWDSEMLRFRRITPKPTPTSYGHVAFQMNQTIEQMRGDLERRSITYHIEPRGVNLKILTVYDPEDNLIELFPVDGDHDYPGDWVHDRVGIRQAVFSIRKRFAEATASIPPEQGYPLLIKL